MGRNPALLYKTSIVGVIVLFIGVGVQPALATVEPENIDTEYYDVNIEFCGLGKNHTVQLTKQQIEELDILFESIREQLDKAETREETVQIYKEAIVDLDNYGLLGDFSVNQVQKLIIENYLKIRNSNLLNKLYDNNQLSDMNAFCLISGNTDDTYFIPPLSMLFHRLSLLFPSEDNIFTGLAIIRFLFGAHLPLRIGSGITFGYYETWTYHYYPSDGWIHTNGLYGKKNWNNDLFGQISEFLFYWNPYSVFVGVTGFLGIKIGKDFEYKFLGYANYVNLGSEHI